MKNITRRLAALAFAAIAASQASAVLIDDFSTGSYSLTSNSIDPITEAVRLGTMLGGERDALLGYTAGPLSVSASVDISGGAVQFFNGSSETSGFLTLQYDGLDGESELDNALTAGTGLGGNFTGSDRFVFDFRFLDAGLAGTVSLTTTVVSSAGTHNFTSFISNGTSFQHQQLFSSFGGANFASVQSVTFMFQGGSASDFTLDSISTGIPGPAAALPFLVGLASLRRRRK